MPGKVVIHNLTFPGIFIEYLTYIMLNLTLLLRSNIHIKIFSRHSICKSTNIYYF